MIQICQKDKEKVYEAIRTGKIDAAEMSFPNLIDDILLTMKGRGSLTPKNFEITRKASNGFIFLSNLQFLRIFNTCK